MTDKLTEALANNAAEALTLQIIADAKRWASFPTDDDRDAVYDGIIEVDAIAKLSTDSIWHIVDAALEAVKRDDR